MEEGKAGRGCTRSFWLPDEDIVGDSLLLEPNKNDVMRIDRRTERPDDRDSDYDPRRDPPA